MLEKYATKVQYKFDMGLSDETGKTIIMSKTYDFVNPELTDFSKLRELGELIANVVDANGLQEAFLISVDNIIG